MDLCKFFKGIYKYINISCYSPVWVSKMLLWISLPCVCISCETNEKPMYHANTLQHVYQVPGEGDKQKFLLSGCLKSWQLLEERCYSRRVLYQMAPDTCAKDIQFLLYFDSSHVNTCILFKKIERVVLMAEEGKLLLFLGS